MTARGAIKLAREKKAKFVDLRFAHLRLVAALLATDPPNRTILVDSNRLQ